MASPHEAAAPFPQPTQSTFSVAGLKGIRLFADIARNNSQQNMIANNVAALANINLKLA